MIDAKRDQLIPLRQGVRDQMPGVKLHSNTPLYWARSGKLETIRIGRRFFTTAAAVRQFIARCNGASEVVGNA